MAAPTRTPRDLPQVPDSVDQSIRGPLSRVIEELQRLMAFRGDPLDAALTVRSAMARGLVDSLGRAMTGSVTYVNTFPSSGGGGGGVTPDLTRPPTVTGLTVTAGFTQVIVQFDAPVYTQGHGNLQTNIYAIKKSSTDPTLPTFDGMTPLVFSAPGALNIVAIPSELNTRWHVWAKYKTVDGVESTAAAGGVNGVSDTTGQDVVQLLAVLTGKIRESELFSALAEPIRSIIRRSDDAAEDALAAALATHQAAQRAAASLLVEAQDRGTAITETRVIVADGDAQLASTITTLAAVVGTNAAAIQTEATARADGDSAEAAARQTLATKLTGLADPSGATLGSITSGLLYDERITRSGADSALASRSDALEASVDTPSTGLLARASSLETVTTHATSGNAALATRASLLEVSVNSPSATPGPGYNPTYAALAVESSARTTYEGYASTLYTVRTTVSAGGRTLTGGFGLAGTSGGTAGPSIDFGVLANRFYIGAPNDGSAPGIGDILPFIVQATPTTINGVSVAAGVYMDTAFIRDGTISNAKIGNAVIDDAKIASLSAAKVTFGTMSGDRIAVGTLQANRITTTTLSAISANLGTVTAGTMAAGTVFAGALSAATGTFSGALSAATGTFAGDISAATGTFAGSLNVKSSPSGARMEITASRIKVFDSGGVERVRIGDLT